METIKQPMEKMAIDTSPQDEVGQPPSQRYRNTLSSPMKTCLVLSGSFAFVYTAYLAIQNLQSSLNQEANLGVTSLCVLYASIILFGTQAPALLNVVGAKRVLVAAWCTHTLYTAANFYPSFATLIPASALLGALAGPMWTAQGLYITATGQQHAALAAGSRSDVHYKNSNEYTKHVHMVLSRFNGIFFMFYELTQITGNLISSTVLSQSSYNSTKSPEELESCGANDCPSSSFSSSNSTSSSDIDQPDTAVVYIMLAIFLACNICGLLLTLFLLPPLPRYTDRTSGPEAGHAQSSLSSSGMTDEMFQCFKMALDSRMLLLMPLFAGQAMAIGVLYADYTKAYITCSVGVRWVGYVMTSYGVCTAILAFSINTFVSNLGRVLLILIAVLVDTGTLVAMLLWQPQPHDSIAIYFLIPAVSGISEGILQAQFNTLIGQVFSTNQTPAFAAYHTSKAAAFTVTFALSNFVCLRYRLYLAVALYFLGLVGYLVTEFRLRKTKTHHLTPNDHEKPLSVDNIDKSVEKL